VRAVGAVGNVGVVVVGHVEMKVEGGTERLNLEAEGQNLEKGKGMRQTVGRRMSETLLRGFEPEEK